MQSWKVHYLNKYPGCSVSQSDSSFDVYSKAGDHLISLRKNGAGQWVDQSEADGLPERHDLSAIPKDSRCYKVVDGKIVKDEQSGEREGLRVKFMQGGKVLSCKDLSEAKQFLFDDKQRVERDLRAPAQA